MATISLFIMPLPSFLYVIVSCIVLTAGTVGALTGAASSHAVGGLGSGQNAALNDSQNAVCSGLSFCSGLARRKYGSAVQGQLSLSDMVQLVAFCGFIQGIRVWRRRSASQEEGMGDAGYREPKDSSGITRGSSWSSTRYPKLGMSKSRAISGNNRDLTTLYHRCRIYRPWPVAKTFKLQVLHHILRRLSFDPKVLQTASSSR